MQNSNQNVRYGFVILHYLAFEMTKKCVDNILEKYNQYNISIVIVDNASNNGSGLQLKEAYKNIRNIEIILNNRNLGFAKGNNKGYDFITGKYEVDYIIVMNNDVIISQPDFLDLIDETYAEYKFAILGPDIYCPYTKMHQNPAHLHAFSKERVQQLFDNYDKLCRHPFYHYYKHLLFSPIKKLFVKQTNDKIIDRKIVIENPVLHGACYIFSKKFIEKRRFCFYPETFLYMEEDILHFQCMSEGLLLLYSPKLKVQHMEDVSTNLRVKSKYRRYIFKNKEMRNSIEVYKSLMENSNCKEKMGKN